MFMGKKKILLVLVGLCLLLGAASLRSFSIRWRLQLVASKLIGKAPYLTWKEVRRLVGTSSAPSLDVAAKQATLAGRSLFLHRCAECHGADARGGAGPSLLRADLLGGSNDSAVRRTILQGIPNTAMGPQSLSVAEANTIITYLRGLASGASIGGSVASAQPFAVTESDLLAAKENPAQWLMYSGSFDGQRHSKLAEIHRGNVSGLRPKWVFQLPKDVTEAAETSPIVVGNTMFVTLPPSCVWALDTRTGALLWSWCGSPPVMVRASNVQHRGIAILGNTVFVGTIDAFLVALDAQTGVRKWQVKVAESSDGYSITSAPLVVGDKVIVGVAGGEFGIRGFLDAYDAKTGARIWRFYTIPAPGEPGNETWGSGNAWQTGGVPTWLTGSFDPTLNLIYWGTGNPGPDFLGDVRPGRNLYSNSVIALDAATGRLRWYFQFTPHDEHDWDAAQIPVLADAVFRGVRRSLILWANRNGFYYVLDRATGEFLLARPFSTQTWALRIDSTGTPIEAPGIAPTVSGNRAAPAVHGATNWWSPSYDSASTTIFVPTMSGSSLFLKGAAVRSRDGSFRGSGGVDDPEDPGKTTIKALNALTGEVRWEYQFPPRIPAPVMGGVLSTDGGLVFAGDQAWFVALDAATGQELWRYNVGGKIAAAPVTFLSDGHQLVTIAASRLILTFALDRK